MEAWQKLHIQKSLPVLQTDTTVNAELISRLQSVEIIGSADVDELNAIQNHGEKAAALYKIIQTRLNGYEHLLDALRNTKQSGAYKIIKDGYDRAMLQAIQKEIPNFQMEHLHEILLTKQEHTNESNVPDFSAIFRKNKKGFSLMGDHIPEEQSIYIPRRISNRTEIKPEIFKQDCEDIFVFKGISRCELTSLVKPYRTNISTKQVVGISSTRFVLLLDESHWNRLRDETHATCSIHLIRCETNYTSSTTSCQVFILEESRATNPMVWQYTKQKIREKSTYISEEQFIEQIIKNSSKFNGVCICDSPGMGKTKLLESLARKCKNRFENLFVIFHPSTKFVHDVLMLKNQESVTAVSFLERILKHVCSHDISTEIILYALEKKWIVLNIFLDGFDEIPNDMITFSKSLLLQLLNLTSVKLFVTSRAHLKTELESTLGVSAYDILPFSEDIQLKYMSTMWRSRYPDLNIEAVKNFAKVCLENLKKTMRYEEKQFMGNPLMCYLVAEVYEKEARLCDSSAYQNLQNPASSVYEMYSKLMEMRFSPDVQTNVQLKKYHVWKAFLAIFPDFAIDLKSYLHITDTPAMAQQLSYGILEHHGNDNELSTKFVHLTFAEFLVAEFLGNCFFDVAMETSFGAKVTSLLGDYVFHSEYDGKTLSILKHSNNASFRLNRFGHPTILSFLNAFLDNKFKSTMDCNKELGVQFFESLKPEKIGCLFQCVILHNHLHIFKFLKALLKAVEKNKNEWEALKSIFLDSFIPINDEHGEEQDSDLCLEVELSTFLFMVAAKYSCADMMESCFNLYQDTFKVNTEQLCQQMNRLDLTPMHIAIERVQYDLVEFLVDKTPLEDNSYMHWCAENSRMDNEAESGDRFQILSLLLKYNKHLVEEMDSCDRSVLHVPNASLKIYKALIQNGADIRAINQGRNILHYAALYMSPEEFHEMCTFLINECSGSDLFEPPGDMWESPVFHIVQYCSGLLPETFEIIMSNLSNVHDEFLNQLFLYATMGNQSVDIIRCILQKGANVELKNEDSQNALQIAVFSNNVINTCFFLSCGLSLHDKDSHGNDCLLHAAGEGNMKMIKLLINCGANLHSTDNDGNTVAHKFINSYAQQNVLELAAFIFNRFKNLDIFKIKNCFGEEALNDFHSISRPENKILSLIIYPSTENLNDEILALISSMVETNSVSVQNLLYCSLINYKTKLNGRFPIQVALEAENLDTVLYTFLLQPDLKYFEMPEKKMLYQKLLDYSSSPIRSLPASKYSEGQIQKIIEDEFCKLLEQKDSSENSFMHRVAEHPSADEYHKIVKAVSNFGCSHLFLETNKLLQTPIHLAAFHGKMKPETVTFFKELNVPTQESNISSRYLNALDIDGNSIQDYASFGNSLSVIEYIMMPNGAGCENVKNTTASAAQTAALGYPFNISEAQQTNTDDGISFETLMKISRLYS